MYAYFSAGLWFGTSNAAGGEGAIGRNSFQRTEDFVKAYGKAAELTEAAGKTSSKKMMEVVAFLSESSAAASG